MTEILKSLDFGWEQKRTFKWQRGRCRSHIYKTIWICKLGGSSSY